MRNIITKWGTVLILFVIFALFGAREVTIANSETNSDDEYIDDQEYEEIIDNCVEGYDFNEIDNIVEKENISVNYSDVVKELVKGNISGSFKNVKDMVKESVFIELSENKKIMLELILVAIIAAIFTNFSHVFINSFVSETGFYLTYLLIFSILLGSFYLLVSTSTTLLTTIIDLMKAFILSYSIAISISCGTTSATGLYELMLIVITIVEWVILKVIIPMANIYVIISLINNLSKEDRFSKMANLIKELASWALKTITAAVIGLNIIKNLILPAIDSVKTNALQKSIAALPGGQAVTALSNVVIGSSVIIKNSIGAGGVIMLLLISIVPLIKIFIFLFVYRLTAAVLQPISDERIVNGINSVADGAKIILVSVTTAIILFVLSIAIIAAATNVRYYGT